VLELVRRGDRSWTARSRYRTSRTMRSASSSAPLPSATSARASAGPALDRPVHHPPAAPA
jgi:hypothetical protein